MGEIKVLLVDDETAFTQALCKRLRRRDIEAEAVDSGEAALEFLQHKPVDVVVLDVRMPGEGGVQTLRQIKKLHPEVEVVMLSGFGDSATTARSREAGAFDYLMKPTGIDDLLKRIRAGYARKTAAAGKS